MEWVVGALVVAVVILGFIVSALKDEFEGRYEDYKEARTNERAAHTELARYCRELSDALTNAKSDIWKYISDNLAKKDHVHHSKNSRRYFVRRADASNTFVDEVVCDKPLNKTQLRNTYGNGTYNITAVDERCKESRGRRVVVK